MIRRLLLDDIDAAGVAFGPRLLALAHQAYEERLAAVGLDLAALIRAGTHALPIARIEADFRAPLRHGDEAEFTVGLAELRERSYSVRIEIAANGRSCAVITQIHACVDRKAGGACLLPPEVADALRRL